MTSTGVRARTGPTAGQAGGAEQPSPEQIRDERIEQAAQLLPEMAELIRLYYRYLPPEEIIAYAFGGSPTAVALRGA